MEGKELNQNLGEEIKQDQIILHGKVKDYTRKCHHAIAKLSGQKVSVHLNLTKIKGENVRVVISSDSPESPIPNAGMQVPIECIELSEEDNSTITKVAEEMKKSLSSSGHGLSAQQVLNGRLRKALGGGN